MAEPDFPGKEAKRKLEQKWGEGPTCPVCASETWTLEPNFVEVRPFHGGNLNLGGNVYPLIMLICSNCGNTQFFNALVLGLIEPQASEETEQKSREEATDA